MNLIKKGLSAIMILLSIPFVILGFIGSFMFVSFEIGKEELHKFAEWLDI